MDTHPRAKLHQVFDLNCNQFDHYLDIVLNKIDPFHDDILNNLESYMDDQRSLPAGMTCLDNELYLPKGLHSTEKKCISIIFDS